MPQSDKPKHHLMKLFDQKKCYTIEQLHYSIDYSLISIRRFLKEVGYYSSFTHNSKWYTLKTIPSFSKNGIWFYRDIGFSKHGNLNQTILHFVDRSTKGLTAKEVFNILSVPCHPILNQMYKKKRIDRFNTHEGFHYLSIIEKKKHMQLMRLQTLTPPKSTERLIPQTAVYVLVEFIKNPEASFLELSTAVEKRGVKAPQKAIAQLFKDHDLKKSPE
jgi:hypothetical protein